MPSIRKIGVAAAAAAISVGAVVGVRAAGRHLVARAERQQCVTSVPPPYDASARARELHLTLEVVDLHADSLLWGRDLLDRGTQGQVDIPRLLEGNVALQVLAASTKSPRHLNIERNDDQQRRHPVRRHRQRLAAGDVPQPAGPRRPSGRPGGLSRGARRRAGSGSSAAAPTSRPTGPTGPRTGG